MPDRAIVVLPAEAQQVRVPFAAEVRGTAAAETVVLTPDSDVSFVAGAGDAVDLPGRLSSYDIEANGNLLTLDRAGDNGVTAEIGVNGPTHLRTADGVVPLDIETRPDGIVITLDGQLVDNGFDTSAVAPTEGWPDEVATGDAGTPATVLSAGGDMAVGFDADVRTTAAAETVQVPGHPDVKITPGHGDRVAFVHDLSDYSFTAEGNFLRVHHPEGGTADLALNGPAELAFANGAVMAEVQGNTGDPTITVGGEPVLDGVAAGDVAYTGANASAVADQAFLNIQFTNEPELDGHRVALQNALRDAWTNWMQHLDEDTDAVVSIRVRYDSDDDFQAFASPQLLDTGDTTPAGRPIGETTAATRLSPTRDHTTSTFDGTITIKTTLSKWSITGGSINTTGVLTHELGHILGFTESGNSNTATEWAPA